MRTWEEHLRIAEKLLADAEYLYERQAMSLTDRDRGMLDLARTHAALAAVRVDQETADRFRDEDEVFMAALHREQVG